MSEIWKDIPGFEGRYQVSNLGRVKSLPRIVKRTNVLCGGFSHVHIPEKILTPQAQRRSGHLEVKLGHNPAKHYRVHRLVAAAFLGPCPSGQEVCHNDNDPTNNRVTNLRYDTRSMNRIDMVKAGNEGRQILKVEQIPLIRSRLANGDTCKEIAQDFGVHPSTISKIKTGRNFAWLSDERRGR